MSDKFTANDLALTLNVTSRQAHRYIEKLTFKEKGKLFIEQDVFDLIVARQSADATMTEVDSEEIVESFTPGDYQEFTKRVSAFPLLNQEIERLKGEIYYHKKQYEKLIEMHHEMTREMFALQKITQGNTSQRNFIEAKEKGFDH